MEIDFSSSLPTDAQVRYIDQLLERIERDVRKADASYAVYVDLEQRSTRIRTKQEASTLIDEIKGVLGVDY